MASKKFNENWPETLAALLLLTGFLMSLLLRNAFLVYLVAVLAGFLGGRIIYIKRFKEPVFPFALMIIGFLLGYLLGNLWSSRFWTAALFALGWGISYYLHWKKIIAIPETEDFLK